MSNRPGPFAQSIAAEIRAELGRQHLTKRGLADMLGEPHVTVTRWVNGDGPMSFDSMDAICEALGVSVVDILRRAEESKGDAVPAPRPPRTRRSNVANGASGEAANRKRTSRDTGRYAVAA
jgi:transcriptional regulator with XRE-family HTH domain